MKALALRVAAVVILVCGPFSAAMAEDCQVAAPDKFLPKNGSTSAPLNGLPAPATENDCAFYNWAWQEFLFATQKGYDKRPSFLSYPTIEKAFPKVFSKSGGKKRDTVEVMSLSVRNIEPILNVIERVKRSDATLNAGDPVPVLTDGVMQASQGGAGAILVDQNHNPIFYTIHVNQVFADFVKANGLDEMERLLADPASEDEKVRALRPVPAELEFRPGAVEFKSSWMIIDGPKSNYSNYIVTQAKVPYLKNEADTAGGGSHLVIDKSRPPRLVNVALLGLHVVGAIDGHPELIWATFEHSDAAGNRDIAPAAEANPDPTKTPSQVIGGSDRSYALFEARTSVELANKALLQTIGVNQKFGTATSVYRMFPGASSIQPPEDERVPEAPWEDPAVYTLNKHIGELFTSNDPHKKDWRRNYRLVGAVWMDKPRGDKFDAGQAFPDDDSRLAGENRLSNMSMESFTQQPGIGAPNCFSCHDTQAQDQLSQMFPGKQLPPRRINISHIFTIVAEKYLASIQH
ncbi:hypothetical protein ACFSOZ_23160 [Mesorhizobium newzealandense]|uniref:Cytochrome c family protein n=1 Tax=Mesorhizobium newzealandense TaxID=1300302 RepID=A0ABW4UER0_9HYPH